MMLVLYSTFLYFAGGGPASNYLASIFPRASNQLTLLFADEDGTTPIDNPLTTDSEGLVSFYAAPGDYEARYGGNVAPVPIDESVGQPVWPDVWIHTQSSPQSTWTVQHHFGLPPHVSVVIDGLESSAEVQHADDETTLITFGIPVTGIAHLRR
jgi:hypothetical protein